MKRRFVHFQPISVYHLVGRFFVHSECETHSSRTVTAYTEHTLSKKSRSIKNHQLRDPPKPSLGIAIEVPRCQATSKWSGLDNIFGTRNRLGVSLPRGGVSPGVT